MGERGPTVRTGRIAAGLTSSAISTASRLCPACGVAEAIPPDAPLWPLGWRCTICGEAVPVGDGIPQYVASATNSANGFDSAAFDRLARSEKGHFWFEPRNRLLVGLADRFFPQARGYLEIGCGTGAVLAPMAASRRWSRLAGADMHPAGLVHARRRLGGRAELVQLDARKIPARAAFDLVGAFDVLEHIPEDDAVMREVHAALVPGGGFLAAVPQHPALWSKVDVASGHIRRYRRGELEDKLRRAGFDILFSTSYASTVLPLMFVSRFQLWRRGSEDVHEVARRELDIHPALNAGLRRMLDLEVALSLRGFCWPAGGSRVIVARKP
jgi:SAM-dependent methyltransferase